MAERKSIVESLAIGQDEKDLITQLRELQYRHLERYGFPYRTWIDPSLIAKRGVWEGRRFIPVPRNEYYRSDPQEWAMEFLYILAEGLGRPCIRFVKGQPPRPPDVTDERWLRDMLLEVHQQFSEWFLFHRLEDLGYTLDGNVRYAEWGHKVHLVCYRKGNDLVRSFGEDRGAVFQCFPEHVDPEEMLFVIINPVPEEIEQYKKALAIARVIESPPNPLRQWLGHIVRHLQTLVVRPRPERAAG